MMKQYVLTEEEYMQLETIKDVILSVRFDIEDIAEEVKEDKHTDIEELLAKSENALESILYGKFDREKHGFDFELSK